MQAFMKRHRLWPPALLMLFALGLGLYAYFSLEAIPGHYQYLWSAPAPESETAPSGSEPATPAKATNKGLRDARLAMDSLREQLEGACENTTLYAVADGASVVADTDGATAQSARLEAIDDGTYAMKPLLLKSGRLIYGEELKRGDRLALLDEKLAVALFNYAEPLDRILLLNGERYRIVGIINDSRRVGDHWEYSLYVPYRAVEKSALAMTALCVETSPIPGAGGWSAFETATVGLSSQGTGISLPKEVMNAELPLRVAACLIGFLAILACLRALNVRSVRLYRAYRLNLREQYAVRLLPRFGWRVALLGLGYAACAFALAQLFMVFVEPVFTFPEWIPAVLVEPKDISTAFWNVWQKQAILTEMRSPELIRVRFFREIMGWACGILALASGLMAARLGEAARRWTIKPDPETPQTEEESTGAKPSLE